MKAEKIDAKIRKWKNAGNEIEAMKKKKQGLPDSLQQDGYSVTPGPRRLLSPPNNMLPLETCWLAPVALNPT